MEDSTQNIFHYKTYFMLNPIIHNQNYCRNKEKEANLKYKNQSQFLNLASLYQGGDCCDGSLQNFPDTFDKELCFPIEIPENDSYFNTIGRRCMNFNRAMQTPNLKCELGKREQVFSIFILTLSSLINEQTIINKQVGKNFFFVI